MYLSNSKLQFPDIETVQCDISDWDATRRIVEELGDIHLLVNIAGVGDTEEALAATPENFDRYVDQRALSLKWFSFNPSMDKSIHPLQSVCVCVWGGGGGGGGGANLSIPNLQPLKPVNG